MAMLKTITLLACKLSQDSRVALGAQNPQISGLHMASNGIQRRCSTRAVHYKAQRRGLSGRRTMDMYPK